MRELSGQNIRCELLSKIITFVMKDNALFKYLRASTVVNCFQKLLPSWWRTTFNRSIRSPPSLWIAFKNYYLRDEGQLEGWLMGFECCCELLSKIIIFVMKDNNECNLYNSRQVVNCFQKLLSSWWRTTRPLLVLRFPLLWIAFKNYYLRDEGQL